MIGIWVTELRQLHHIQAQSCRVCLTELSKLLLLLCQWWGKSILLRWLSLSSWQGQSWWRTDGTLLLKSSNLSELVVWSELSWSILWTLQELLSFTVEVICWVETFSFFIQGCIFSLNLSSWYKFFRIFSQSTWILSFYWCRYLRLRMIELRTLELLFFAIWSSWLCIKGVRFEMFFILIWKFLRLQMFHWFTVLFFL